VQANDLPEDCSAWLGAQSANEDSYLNPMSIRRIRQLLDHCTSKCHPSVPSSFLPTRLIDVGSDASAIPRLVLSSSIHKTRQTNYAALSYCWGDEKDAESQFKTERESLQDRCAGMLSESMTPTTRDAIALSKAIGLRYIWIDALCIVQDDTDDWSHESSQMNLVYRHAFVTFCTLNSDSCHQSFIHRAPAVKVSFQSTIRKDIKGYYLIQLRSRTGFYMGRKKFPWDYSLSRWAKRCWTYQEQEMSTRRLLFGSSRMHFTCAGCQWSEGDDAPTDRSRLKILGEIARFKEHRITSKELYDCWSFSVHEYGSRSVTFDKDRLPAIAGLARIMGEALHDQYLAGLWKGDAICGLLWISTKCILSHSLEVHLQNIRRRNYVAPSWSWASCPIISSRRDHNAGVVEESIVVDVNIDIDGEDPYGQVSGGFLRIHGKMAPMPTWILTGQRDRWSNSWIHKMGGPFDDDDLYIVTDWLHEEEEVGLENLTLVLLVRFEAASKTGAPSLAALLLNPVDGSDEYYRVGLVESNGSNAYEVMSAWFKDRQEETICII
jgi:hypothetical protein